MSVKKPYYLTVRQFKDGNYAEGGRARYIRRPDYSNKPSNYIRAFLLLQKDLLELFNYIEPSDNALSMYSFRTQELLVRTCIEIEANFKAIFALNKYSKNPRYLNIKDYYLINSSHYLSEYSVKLPYWTGHLTTAIRAPFASWAKHVDPRNQWVLGWYQAYNTTKHDRSNALPEATFENLIDAFSALVIIISAQYMTEEFSPALDVLQLESGINDGFDTATGDYFKIHYPLNVPESERYDFDWQSLSKVNDAFQQFDYDNI